MREGAVARLPAIFRFNLLAIILLGVAVSGWTLHYTDWFPEIGGLLALGGVLSWLAFVSKLISEERLKQLQAWAQESIFDRKATLAVCIALLLLGVAVASCVGSIEIDALSEESTRLVTVSPVEEAEGGDPLPLPVHGAIRVVAWTKLWSPTQMRVRVRGYPDIVVQVRAWHRQTLRVPEHLLRSAVLIHPAPTVGLFLLNNPMKLIVRAGDHTATLEGYRGESVWLGCDDSVEIPTMRLQRWRDQYPSEVGVRASWERPLAIRDVDLQPGERIEAQVVTADGAPYALVGFGVKTTRWQDFPQEETLDVPKPR